MINITTPQELTKIYLVTNCYGDPNKVYIGKEKSIKNTSHRKSYHKKKFGKDIIFTYIDEIESLNRKDWKPLECFWIEYFGYFGFDLINKNGGGGGPENHKNDTKLKISLSNIGKGTKKVYQYNFKGNLIKVWNNAELASNELGISRVGIVMCCLGKSNYSSNFIWKYEKLDNIKFINDFKTIYQFDLFGNLVKIWESVNEASKHGFSKTDIYHTCIGKQKLHKNFIWKYNYEKKENT